MRGSGANIFQRYFGRKRRRPPHGRPSWQKISVERRGGPFSSISEFVPVCRYRGIAVAEIGLGGGLARGRPSGRRWRRRLDRTGALGAENGHNPVEFIGLGLGLLDGGIGLFHE